MPNPRTVGREKNLAAAAAAAAVVEEEAAEARRLEEAEEAAEAEAQKHKCYRNRVDTLNGG